MRESLGKKYLHAEILLAFPPVKKKKGKEERERGREGKERKEKKKKHETEKKIISQNWILTFWETIANFLITEAICECLFQKMV